MPAKRKTKRSANPALATAARRAPAKAPSKKQGAQKRRGPSGGPQTSMRQPGLGSSSLSSSVTYAPVAKGVSLTNRRQMNKHTLCLSYAPGFVYIGNGTVGAVGSVYFANTPSTPTTVYSGLPIRIADSVFGEGWITDIIKHYSLIRFKSVEIELVSNQSTATGGSIAMTYEPGGGFGFTVVTGNTPNYSYQAIASSQYGMTLPIWESRRVRVPVDETKWFAIPADSPGAAQSVPSAFQTSPGSLFFGEFGCPTGVSTHVIVIHVEIELDGFTSLSFPNPTLNPPISTADVKTSEKSSMTAEQYIVINQADSRTPLAAANPPASSVSVTPLIGNQRVFGR